MVVKVKEPFEKTRHIKNNDRSKKNTFYVDKEMLDIMKKYYQIKRTLIISILHLIQHNRILSRYK